jgi:hypothetical protein
MLANVFKKFTEACKAILTRHDYLSFSESEFKALVQDVCVMLPRYDNEAGTWPPSSQRAIRYVLAHNHLAGFLSRTGFETAVREGRADPSQVAVDFEREVARDQCSLIQILVLDGLEVCSDDLCFARGRFVRLSEAMLKDVKGEHGLRPSELDRLIGVYGLELKWTAPNPPWGAGALERLGLSPRKRIQTMGYPWVTYINLWNLGKIRVAGAYETTDSLLVPRSERYIHLEEPVWQDHYEKGEESDSEEWVSECPLRLLSVRDAQRFASFLERLEAGRSAVQLQTHRGEIALRYFARVADTYRQHHLQGDGLDIDGNEDILVDGVTALETLLLAGEKRGKGRILAGQLSALLADDSVGQRTLRKRVEKIYKLRSAVLHGDTRPSSQELRMSAIQVEELTRRCLMAFLLLQGDRRAIAQGARDERIAQMNRQRASF